MEELSYFRSNRNHSKRLLYISRNMWMAGMEELFCNCIITGMEILPIGQTVTHWSFING